MAQRVKNVPACTECVDGQIRVFFANFSEKRLREDYVSCQFCCGPEGNVSAIPMIDEEQIAIDQYYQYIKDGWSQFNPV